ncbi:MAG: G-D-S-L family lipolytic protein, partial [Planctomycetia bacterium]
YKELKHYKPQDWNELVITVIDGKALCLCNDDILEVALPVPETGPIGLEGDSGQLEYRRIRITKLP